MNDLELKQLWQTAHEQAESSLALSKQNAHDLAQMKVQNLLQSMKPIKLFALIVGMVWVGIGAGVLSNMYMYSFAEVNKYFLYSASAQVWLTSVALAIYLYQLISLHSITIVDPILKTQEKLAELKITTLWIVRILFLQLPFWTTFWWNDTMIQTWSGWQWATVLSITATFTFVALWLFVNVKYSNRDKKWFQLLFSGNEWLPLLKAMDLLSQVKAYREAEQ
jgi:hypothetical protein